MSDKDITFELYKLEYEKGAERYENIYKSVWTNFNYLVLLAGGILAFGSNSKALPQYMTIILACLPLLYWYVAVFKPGDRYGDSVVERLSQVEQILNQHYAAEIDPSLHLSPPDSPPTSATSNLPLRSDYGLQHFTKYQNSRRWKGPLAWFANAFEIKAANVIKWAMRKDKKDEPEKLRIFPPPVRLTTLAAAIGLSFAVYWAVAHRDSLKWDGKKDSVTVEQTQKQLEVRVTNADIEEVKSLLQNSTQARQDLELLKSSVNMIADQLKAISERQQQPSGVKGGE